MTMIDVDTSPLQAAREWRGVSLAVAARTCSLTLAHAEALESGEVDAFDSVDEMVAAAVLYGASLGIGREEAMALFDRTVGGEGVEVRLPDAGHESGAGIGGFSTAVSEKSARISQGGITQQVLIPLSDPNPAPTAMPLTDGVMAALPLDSVVVVPVAEPTETNEPTEPTETSDDFIAEGDFGDDPLGAVVNSGSSYDSPVDEYSAIELDENLSPDAWRDGTGELEQWAATHDDALEGGAATRRGGVGARMAAGSYSAIERVFGTDRADRIADRSVQMSERTRAAVTSGRDKLRKSEHATLILAIGGGAILVALLVAIASALGGGNDVAKQPATTKATTAKTAPAKATGKAAPGTKAAPKPVLAPAQIKVQVFNAGRTKGMAKTQADKLKGLGYRIGEVGNTKTTYGSSMIIYPKGLGREARRLSKQTGITTMDVAPGGPANLVTVITV